MRLRTFLFVASLAMWPVVAGAQTPTASQQGPTPQQAIDAPATHIGASVTWVVRFNRVLSDIGTDGSVTNNRILYEWRDASGNWTGVMVVAPASGLGHQAAEATVVSHDPKFQAAPRLIKGTVKAIESVAGPAGKIVAVVLEDVLLPGMPAARPGALTHTWLFSGRSPMTGAEFGGNDVVFKPILDDWDLRHSFSFGAQPVATPQGAAASQSGPTPQQVLDAPKDTVGATVSWVVRYRNVIVDLQPDGRIASSSIVYEWRDPSGAGASILILGPSLQDTRFAAESAGHVAVLQAEPRLLSGTVRGVQASTEVDGKATLAIAVDNVTLAPLPISEKHRITGSYVWAPGGSAGGVYAPGQGVSWPVVLKEAKPAYPVEAIASKREGQVELELTIAPDGTVSDVRITKSLDSNGPFDKAAVSAAKQWLFKPGAKDGVPVPVKVSLILDFKVKK